MNQTSSPLPDRESKADYIRRGFDSIAKRYDLLNDLMTAGLHRRWKREAATRLSLPPDGLVLDLCAGTGDLAFRAVRTLSGRGHAVALDFSREMMRVGQQRASSRDQERASCVSWLCGDAGKLPFADRTFDGAMVGFGLRNVTSIEKTLDEVIRVIKPGGTFVSLDTAGSEIKAFAPLYAFQMNWIVPVLGKWLAGSKEMYSYLTVSAAAFSTPHELCQSFERAGFDETGFTFRPRLIGGAALVWGKRPCD